ncbi:hypothetical protein Pmani_003841 [Petrolisthes manimaculis]|uniref:Uncharacterized protein n=1 Tax=Petrolisthes manimaculis TaxID=1843537 RepID=A0AAE1QEX2_9EUCA|nr:hypothetical protein Pmani_003841 [Petrolisthes manimaculis]
MRRRNLCTLGSIYKERASVLRDTHKEMNQYCKAISRPSQERKDSTGADPLYIQPRSQPHHNWRSTAASAEGSTSQLGGTPLCARAYSYRQE